MKTTVNSARRGFLWKTGAALSAPLAAVAPLAAIAANAKTPASDEHGALRARLAVLEDLNAIRELMLRYVRHVDAGAHDEIARLFADAARAPTDDVRALAADPLGTGEDTIEIAPGGDAATSRLHCTARIEKPIEPVSPLVEMARAQGGGVTKRSARGVLEGCYVKRDGVWKIDRIEFRAT